MGKRAKKKASSGVKLTRNPVASTNPIDEKSNPNIDSPDDALVVVSDRKGCPHVDKVINVDKVSAKLGSSESVRCEDCREEVADRRASRKQGKNKGGADPKQKSKAIWVCLVCGHFSCGGVGLPATPQSHAVRHARHYHHPLAVQFENPQLRWCFLCNTLLRAKKVEDGSEQKNVLEDIVKMIKRRPSEGPTVDVEAVLFGSGSVASGIKSEASASIGADGEGGYVIRGLVNLGNTCFFNSIMQNLLAMNRLRDYFLKFDVFSGPLTVALKNLFTETSNKTSLQKSINPKSLFGSICAKAPQFRGYQQQDSHELLRCLLDRLCTEELILRKQNKSSQDGDNSLRSYPTFVDDIFGGRLSSTVSCLECGHTSVVYEPFLDLSLPVPTRRPPSKGAQSISNAKISKPPKRSGKVLPKVSRDAASPNSQSSQGNEEKSLSHVHPTVPVSEGMIVPSDALLEFIDAGVMADYMGLTSQDLCSIQKSSYERNCEGVTGQLATVDDSTWLDFLDQDTLPNGDDAASHVDDSLTNQGSEIGSVQPVDSLQNNLNADTEMKLTCTDITCSPIGPSDASLESIDAGVIADYLGLSSLDLCSIQKFHYGRNCDGVTRQLATEDDSTWLDFLDQDTLRNGADSVSQVDHVLTNQGSETRSVQPVDSLQNYLDADTQMKLTCTDSCFSPVDLMCLDDQRQSESAVCDIDSEFSKKLLIKDVINVEHSSAFCSQICSVDSNLGTDSYTRLSEDEAPLQLQESEVLLLPYKEVTSSAGDTLTEGCEVSSAAVGWEQDSLDLDGVGDLYNEPESDAQLSEQFLCNSTVSQANELSETRFTVSNISESDPEEADNTDAPVSVESCLAYFTKPELLSKSEHAWQCENCTKVLKEKRMRSKNKSVKPRSHSLVNGHEGNNPNGASCSGTSPSTGLRNNGSTDNDALETFEDRLLSPKGTSPRAEQDSVSWLLENNTEENQGEASSQVNIDLQNNIIQLLEAPLISAKSESEDSESEETDFKRVGAERDATKQILIDKVPPILSIHLKRFSQDARGRLNKLNGHVNFRDTVDLRPYVDTRCLQEETYKYQLIGVVIHSGTMRGGHYVAYVRGGPKIAGKDKNAEDFAWYYASDSHVREVSLEEVLRSDAYILFYEET
ncbi:Ubiquitin carboxyl-terminal hydrolase 2 [Capsicum baccatum]|uniref:ubiquitinyl hydrolase 1 n=1 Tax=Capsicum baccatum TaxID=33114 RepID=A0A2G2WU95_CAPBA|nr:Ubiquitin carboxyl-terminal hydrolase 2 [Capsicum baccatum]